MTDTTIVALACIILSCVAIGVIAACALAVCEYKHTKKKKKKFEKEFKVVYLCTRDTVNPVYNDLADLVGLYVEVA